MKAHKSPVASHRQAEKRTYLFSSEDSSNSLSWDHVAVGQGSVRTGCLIRCTDDIVDAADHSEAYACDTLHKQGRVVVLIVKFRLRAC